MEKKLINFETQRDSQLILMLIIMNQQKIRYGTLICIIFPLQGEKSITISDGATI